MTSNILANECILKKSKVNSVFYDYTWKRVTAQHSSLINLILLYKSSFRLYWASRPMSDSKLRRRKEHKTSSSVLRIFCLMIMRKFIPLCTLGRFLSSLLWEKNYSEHHAREFPWQDLAYVCTYGVYKKATPKEVKLKGRQEERMLEWPKILSWGSRKKKWSGEQI